MTTDGANDPKRIKALPFAHGRSFQCLDDYLGHLRERAGPIGQPWYREVGAGVYERVTNRRPSGPQDHVTRAQLLARYGFER